MAALCPKGAATICLCMGSKIIIISVLGLAFLCPCRSVGQDFRHAYNDFKKSAQSEYSSFREDTNRKYADFLRRAWEWYEGKAPLPVPREENPVPPRPYRDEDRESVVEMTPVVVDPVVVEPQPLPVEPVREDSESGDTGFRVEFYGVPCDVRLPDIARSAVGACTPAKIGEAWERLAENGLNNAVRDCLETRIRYNLCDWAYLLFLQRLGKEYCADENAATLLTAFLYSQSGYQMRLAIDGGKLEMLYGSRHMIYGEPYYNVKGTNLYPVGKSSGHLRICDFEFPGEKPLSLAVEGEQLLGKEMSEEREIISERYADMKASSCVQKSLIDFFGSYPPSEIGNDPLSRWAMVANVPMAKATGEVLYSGLKSSISGLGEEEAANRILNWVQTGFVYEYDDKVWGYDRAFFAEETLFYPYCDCEDRSILFSRLVRDLLGLDVALIYYPGHLATAVCFSGDVEGSAMMIGGRKFIVCDPTFIGAPVGRQMPGLDYGETKAILLRRGH